MLDKLRAVPDSGRYAYRDDGPGVLAVEARGSAEAGNWWLDTHQPGDLLDIVEDRVVRWRAGEPDVTAPAFFGWDTRYGRSGIQRGLTASKLTKDWKDLVARLGIPWDPRTNDRDYLRKVLKETLMEDVPASGPCLYPGCRLIAVGGAKGGVGKSTVTAALAAAIAAAGQGVLIVDLDVTGPSQHILWDAGPLGADLERRIAVAWRDPATGVAVVSPGQVFQPGAATWGVTETVREWISFTGTNIDLDGIDTVLFDMPPGETPAHDALAETWKIGVHCELHVTTGNELSLADTALGLARRHTHHYRPTRVVVENLAYAEDGGVRVPLYGAGDKVETLAADTGSAFGGSLPFKRDFRELATAAAVVSLATFVASIEPTDLEEDVVVDGEIDDGEEE